MPTLEEQKEPTSTRERATNDRQRSNGIKSNTNNEEDGNGIELNEDHERNGMTI